MAPNEMSGPAGGCPSPEELCAYGQGQLPLERLEAVAEHIDSCPHCASSLQDLAEERDTLVSHLRRYVPERGAAGSADDEAMTIPEGPPDAPGEFGSQATDPTRPGQRGAPTGKPFGQYELLEELERGGMGVVFKARQVRLNRIVALKMIRAGVCANSEEVARFRIEAEAVARLHHPHVVPIYEFGEVDGQPYFSMEFLEGGSLAKKLAGKPLSEREAAELVQTLARAVHAAHEQHIVHRDLKPGNVLLTTDATPKVADFGLAKLLDADSVQTQSEALLGTASYMAPEQAWGHNTTIGPATDVYALGAILYEALTGCPPFRASSRMATLEQVRSADPKPPSALRPGLARDLEAVCLKCLHKEPAQRYPSAEALADDLARWLREEPTEARPLRWPGRVARAFRRHRRVVMVGAACVVAGLAVAAAIYLTSPERALEDLERRLASGEKKVTLIGPTGKPRWSDWCVGAEAAQTSQAQDGTFTIHTWTLSMLDLMRNPRRGRYRIQAEVRHLNSGDYGAVGIYCNHREQRTSLGTAHCFTHLTFNDIRDAVALYDDLVPKLPPPPPPLPPRPAGNQVRLFYRLYRDGNPATHWDAGVAGQSAELFRAAGLTPAPPWRTLTLLVTPERVEARWDVREERVGHLVPAGLPAATLDALNDLRDLRPGDPSVAEVDPAFALPGSLGLYLYDSSASFRNVTIEPLGEAD
jgi:eukaryotic-like serine/threonine-protein kinase